MRLNSKIWILICILCALHLPGYACDTSLIRMFAAQSPEEGFFKSLEKMAVNTERVGSRAQWNIFEGNALQALMEDWLAFETEYRNSPPHWIEEVDEWPTKFIAVARQIGIMRAAARNEDYTALHDASLELSQKLNVFLLEVEVSEYQQILVQIPLSMQNIRNLRRERNRQALHEASLTMLHSVKRLQALAKVEHKQIYDALLEKVTKLHKTMDINKPDADVFTWDLYNIMKEVDDTYRLTTDMLLVQKQRENEEEAEDEDEQ